jgi:FAD/FMN-containing dehydrogenase
VGGQKLAQDIRHTLVNRGDPRYEAALARLYGDGPAPARRPEVIVQVGSAEDVSEAVLLARERGLPVTVRYGRGGTGGPPHDGGMLLDLSRLRRLKAADGEATVRPGVTGHELVDALAPEQQAFPVAHRGRAALGGFVLAGGIGWNSRAWGPACAGLTAVEAVTAAGEIVRCDDDEHADLLWAARGGGPELAAVITALRLRPRHLPPAIMTTRYVFPLADVEDVAGWADGIAATTPANVELSIVLTNDERGPCPVVAVSATAFSCAWNDAIRCLEPLRDCPYAGRALIRQVDQPTPFAVLFTGSDALWPQGRRAAADSLWVNDGLGTLLPRLARHIEDAPSADSLVVAAPAPAGPAHPPEMAFAPLGRVHLGCYAMWTGRTADEANRAWLRALVTAAEPRATGFYAAEADLTARPGRVRRSFTPAAWERLQTVRARYDPDGVFATYPRD